MSTPALGPAAYRAQNVPRDNPKWNERYLNGHMNTSLIKTASGLTVNLKHDVVNLHSYDRLNSIAGTKGVLKDYPARLYLDGQPRGEDWGTIDPYKEKFEDPLWKKQGEIARSLAGTAAWISSCCID